ncbi:MAG TPA: YidB family protein [Actinomycetota bacterium]|nr:YidB family protein [Actinomycetota bacterium]
MDVKEMLGTAVKEAKKHPELLDSVIDMVKGKVGGSKAPAKKTTAKKAASARKPTGAKTTKTAKAKGAKRDAGGLAGLLGDLDLAGLAEQAGSWVGTGPNKRVSGKKVEQALGSEKVAAAAKRAGVSKEEAASGIAKLLPAVVDYLTPEGRVPTKTQAEKRLDALKGAKG